MNRFLLLVSATFLFLLGLAAVAELQPNALESTASATTVDPVVQSLVTDLQSDVAAERRDAATGLAGLDDPAAASALVDNLADPDAGSAYATIEALAASRSPEVVAALIEAVESNQKIVRQRAILALSRMESAAATHTLGQALNDSDTAAWAAQGLARLGTDEAQAYLLIALSDVEMTSRRHAAMAAIEYSADPEVAERILARALSSDNPVLVQNAAMLRDFMTNNGG